MRPSGPDWIPQPPQEEQRPWGWDREIDLVRLRRAIWLDCDAIANTQFVVYSPSATDAQRRLVTFHPRRPLDAAPCQCVGWRRGDLCEHVLCVLLHVGDREAVRALRRLVPVAEEGR